MNNPVIDESSGETMPSDPGGGSAGDGSPGWPRMFAALSVRNFRLFYIGQGLSLTGTWMRRTALGWIVYDLEKSLALLGTVTALTTLPMFLFSPIAGALADRMDKRRLVVWTQVVELVCSTTIALLITLGLIETWHLMVLSFIGGVAFAFEVPARQSFLVEMVGRKHLLNSIALNSALVNGTRIAGPALAGIALHYGQSWCFWADAVSYVVVIWTLLQLRIEAHTPQPRPASQLGHLLEGVRETWRNRPVRLVLVSLFFLGVFGWGFDTLLPAIARDTLGLRERAYGNMRAVFGMGAIVAALTVASLRESRDRRVPLFLGMFTMALGNMMLSLWANYWWIVASLVVAGFGGILFVSTGNTMIQLNVEDSIRGRVMGVWAVAFGGSLPFGAWVAGQLAEFIGPMRTIGVFGGILFCAGVGLYLTLGRGSALPSSGALDRG